MQDLSGQTIKGYKLGKRIAIGGFGAVYRALQESVGRDVAVKIILPEYANQPDFIRRFEVEAHIVARLEHPYIVPLYDYWRDPDGAYLVMRWLRGGTLHDKIGQGLMGLQQVLQMLDQVGTALAAAHRRGVVHRDLKPSNILLDEDDNAYLADFGIAKDLASAPTPFQTLKGTVVGSPAYSSPEQIESQPITQQTDIYSLGVMLYEVLTGELPFKSTTPVGFFFKHIHDPVPPLSAHRKDLPTSLNSVIQRAAAKQPGDRYPDVLSLVEDFRRALDVSTSATVIAAPGRAAPGAATPGGRPAANNARAGNGRSSAPSSTGYETVLYDPAGRSLPIVNPYKGLRAFQEADQDDFFGREALVEHLLARMNKASVLAHSLVVVGPSGSGKSSVVRAGLVPAIRRGALPGSDHWFVAEMFPGARPLEELASALLGVAVNRPPNLLDLLQENEYGLLRVLKLVLPTETELLLVIDQFEEVFTLVEDEAARTHFLNSLLAAVTAPDSGLRLIFTLRADFYDRPLLYPGFSELIRRRTEVVVPLSEQELRDSITRPAELVGVSFDPELVAAIVRDVGEQPGALPLLQYVLTELFERRSGARIPLEAYRNIGGVLGALSRRADEIYETLDAPAQEAAEQLFLRLVTLGEGAEDTRRRVLLAELASIGSDPQILERVIATYSVYRLLTFDHDPSTRSPTIEVAHEALIRSWSRLRKWLDASRDDLRLQRRLNAAAADWVASGRDRSYLASGARLEQFDMGGRDTRIALNNEERAYLDASVQERDTQRTQEEARQKRELELARRARNVLRVLAAVLLVAALGAAGLSVLAFGQRQQALTAEGRANSAAQLAQQNAEAAERLKNQALSEAERADANAKQANYLALLNGARADLSAGSTDGALALSLLAVEQNSQSVDAQQVLAEAAYAPGTRAILQGHSESVNAVAVNVDRQLALSGGDDNALILWNLADGSKQATLEGHTDKINAVVFSADGATAFSASNDDTIIAWDVAKGQLKQTFASNGGDVLSIALSPDGRTIVSGGKPQKIDDATVSTVTTWDVATGRPIKRFVGGQAQEVSAVAFSPDSTQILSGSDDQDILLWNAQTGEVQQRFVGGHRAAVLAVSFSPDGKQFVSGSEDTTAALWAIGQERPLRIFTGHSRDVMAVAFSPDGSTLFTGSEDGRIGIWDAQSGVLRRFLQGHGGAVRALAVASADGRTLVSASSDTTLRLWDTRNGAANRQILAHPERVVRVAYLPDGKRAVTASADDTLALWNLETGKRLRVYEGLGDDVSSLALSRDGTRLLAGSGAKSRVALVWNVETGAQVSKPLQGHTKEISAAAISPDGKGAITGDGNGVLLVWNLLDYTQVFSFTGHTDKVNYVVYSADGTMALSASKDKTVLLWNVKTGDIVQTFKGHTGNVRSAVFSPDGTQVLSAGEDKTMILWDSKTGQRVRSFVGHTGQIWQAIFTPDGQQALSASADFSIRLWDLDTGQELRRYTGVHTDAVRDIVFSPDKQHFLTSSDDKSIVVWRYHTQDGLLTWVEKNRYRPPLSPEQRDLYHLGPPTR